MTPYLRSLSKLSAERDLQKFSQQLKMLPPPKPSADGGTTVDVGATMADAVVDNKAVAESVASVRADPSFSNAYMVGVNRPAASLVPQLSNSKKEVSCLQFRPLYGVRQNPCQQSTPPVNVAQALANSIPRPPPLPSPCKS